MLIIYVLSMVNFTFNIQQSGVVVSETVSTTESLKYFLSSP